MGRPSKHASYLQFRGHDDELDALDVHYCERPLDGAPNLFYRLGDTGWLNFWGEPASAADTLENVGARGRIWALCLLMAQYRAIDRSDESAAAQIIERAEARASPALQQLKEILGRHRKLRREDAGRGAKRAPDDPVTYLQHLISFTTREGFPPADSADLWLDLVLEHAENVLLRDAADPQAFERLVKAAGTVATLPSTIFRGGREVAEQALGKPKAQARASVRASAAKPIRERDARLGKDWKAHITEVHGSIRDNVIVDDGERTYSVPKEDEADENVADILAKLQGTKRLIVVTGEPLLGKKTKVKGVLRVLAHEDDQLVFALRKGNRIMDYLPVLAISASDGNYRDLVDTVATFLDRYAGAAHGKQKLDDSKARRRTTDHFAEAVENIFAQYRSHPALFVITDVEAFESDRARHAILDSGIRRLIEAILAANRSNRIVVTTNDNSDDANEMGYLARPRDIERVPITPPSVGDLESFVHPVSFRDVPQDKLDTADPTIRGDDLVALAALLGLSYEPSGRGRYLDGTEWRIVEAFLAQTRNQREAERRPLYKLLVAAIGRWQLLHPLALVAASHDGVRDDSLAQLIEEWWSDGIAFDLPCGLGELVGKMETFSSIAGERFLRRRTIPRYDPDEYGPGEKHSRRDKIWDMDPLVGHWFLDALAEDHPALVSEAHRLIARIARQRAQTKKVQMRAALGSRVTEDASRDIQSYVSLLASTQFSVGDAIDAAGLPLRCSEENIYSVRPDRFDPARALRFASHSLLKEDIDHDYRLTMIFDEDALRLDLYLLLFLEPGRPYPTKLGRLSLPDTLPPHIVAGVFHDDEVLEMMSTVALSAYHAQEFQVLEKIGTLAKSFVALRAIDREVPAKLARLWCSQIDARILLGGEEGDGGHARTLAELRALKREWFPGVGGSAAAILDAGMSMGTLKAYMRLLAREAELLGLLDPMESAACDAYDILIDLETALSSQPAQHDPFVLSGRVARRYIRYLLSEPRLATLRAIGASLEPTLRTARGLLAVNTSRLRRFSGAERVGVMLDRARLQLIAAEVATAPEDQWRHLEAARDYADAANRRAFSGSVSHASKLDVLAVQSEANRRLVAAVHAGADDNATVADEALEWAGIAAHDLSKMAGDLQAKPSFGLARLLEARALIAEYRHAELGLEFNGETHPNPLGRAREKLSEAQRVMSSIGDKSIASMVAAAQAEIRALQGFTKNNT